MPKTSIDHLAMPDRIRSDLESQAGYLLRRAYQRATSNLAEEIGEDLTAPQFATLARLWDLGPLSQNRLGRLVDMEPATIHGVIRRLKTRGLVDVRPDDDDRRRMQVTLTKPGRDLIERLIPLAKSADGVTMSVLSVSERATFLRLLQRIAEDS